MVIKQPGSMRYLDVGPADPGPALRLGGQSIVGARATPIAAVAGWSKPGRPRASDDGTTKRQLQLREAARRYRARR